MYACGDACVIGCRLSVVCVCAHVRMGAKFWITVEAQVSQNFAPWGLSNRSVACCSEDSPRGARVRGLADLGIASRIYWCVSLVFYGTILILICYYFNIIFVKITFHKFPLKIQLNNNSRFMIQAQVSRRKWSNASMQTSMTCQYIGLGCNVMICTDASMQTTMICQKR